MSLSYIDQAEIAKKKILARFDFNVPLDGKKITDTTRIDLALPTIEHLIQSGASKIILMSHLGRPKGQVQSKYSLEPVAEYLADKLNEEVCLTENCTDPGNKTLINLNTTKIVLLENLRFHPQEEQNDLEFAKTLASYADIYVNDAFGAAHRKHASTYGVVSFFQNKSYGGFLLKSEIQALLKIIETPEKPFVAILGGAKVSDKIKTIESLLPKVQHILLGGAMAYPFLKAHGHKVGKSLCSEEDLILAKKIIQQDKHNKILHPTDHIVSTGLEGNPSYNESIDINDAMMGLDIGLQTLIQYSVLVKSAKTIFWNGPMGLFENPNFNKGTFEMARLLSESQAFTLIGGGDSLNAVNQSGLASKMSHISTGGGASLEFIEKGELPGVQALKYGVES